MTPGRLAGGPVRKMRLLSLVAATYFMVSGGPYGIEDILGNAGYGKALLLLILVPLVWSLPTSLMVGELASAMPREGGYYWWVKRALGGFWGFQEAWLSLGASIFDMAIYPTISVLYLTRLAPSWTAGHRGTLWALAIMVLCAVWNLAGAKAVGEGSIGMFCLLISPFAVLIGLGLGHGLWGHAAGGGLAALARPVAAPAFSGAVLVCLWNYMGWDNASTVAQEVENPQRNYPLAMLAATGLVMLTYVLPMAAVAVAGIPADQLSTGAWTDAARSMGGPGLPGAVLAFAVVMGGIMTGVGMFNALVMSYSRIPAALAEEGLLPAVLMSKTRTDVPWVSVLCCCTAWALALNLSFERLISIDLVLYGGALLLEFVALVVLRFTEPELTRPFRIPGGKSGAIAAAVGPAILIGYALWAARDEHVGTMPALEFAALVGLAGAAVYALAMTAKRLAGQKAGLKV